MVNLCYISFQVPNRDNYREKGNSGVFMLKIDQGIEETLKIKPRNIAIRTNATYASRFQIETIIEKKGNSDVFLMKIDQGIEEILKIKPRNIAIRTDYGKLTLLMLPGSKSRHL